MATAHQFGQPPAAVSVNLEPFHLQIAEEDIAEFKAILRLSRIGPSTWANQQQTGQLGISQQWLANAKDAWLNDFDWRAHETRINALPNFRTTVEDPECGNYRMHFVALFSSLPDAVPVVFMHGWPGSFMEFLPMMELLSRKYRPETLPYQIIVPSLPGYGLSSATPLHREFTLVDAARIVNQMMVQLGFGDGYIAQGGDVGSMLSSILARDYAGCKATHVNLLSLDESKLSTEGLNAVELERLAKTRNFFASGMAYAMEQGTRPATIGLVLSASPLSMLAWIGEKLFEWADEPLSLDDVLANVSLYWFTSTYPGSLYPYRAIFGGDPSVYMTPKNKPLGFSEFAAEISAFPKSWVETTFPNMVFYREHDKGGHFAALEQPEIFLEDIEAFINIVGRPALLQ